LAHQGGMEILPKKKIKGKRFNAKDVKGNIGMAGVGAAE